MFSIMATNCPQALFCVFCTLISHSLIERLGSSVDRTVNELAGIILSRNQAGLKLGCIFVVMTTTFPMPCGFCQTGYHQKQCAMLLRSGK
jgi:hypothetical protein